MLEALAHRGLREVLGQQEKQRGLEASQRVVVTLFIACSFDDPLHTEIVGREGLDLGGWAKLSGHRSKHQPCHAAIAIRPAADSP